MNQRIVGTRFLVIKTAKDAAAGRFDQRPVREALLKLREDERYVAGGVIRTKA